PYVPLPPLHSFPTRRSSDLSASALISFVTCRVLVPFARSKFAQSMPECHALIEHEAFAAPAALRFRHLFQIFEDAALEMIDLGRSEEHTSELQSRSDLVCRL